MSSAMRKRAVFIDRDGTINREVGILRDKSQLRIIPGAAGAIKKLNKLGFLVIVITNQPVVARGWLTEKDVEDTHNLLRMRLKRAGAGVDAVYYCPHHPEANLTQYRKKCRCRKPGTGMVVKAAKDFDIDMENSFMIGDMTQDILAGKRAKLKTILVKTGYAGEDGKYAVEPDFTVNNLNDAVKVIDTYAR